MDNEKRNVIVNTTSSVLYTNIELLESVLKALYVLTDVRITCFDNLKNKVFSYPPKESEFCSLIKQKHPEKCLACNEKGFQMCAKAGHYVSYHCHAGMIDAVMPLMQNDQIIGYIMFGQMRPDQSVEKHLKTITDIYGKEYDTAKLQRSLQQMTIWDDERIHSTVALLDICISYLLVNKIFFTKKNQLMDQLDDYINAHLNQKITIEELCRYFNTSRTTLYTMFQNCMDCSLKKYICRKKIDAAKMLLITTEMPICEIGLAVGFEDYNYFLRIFKLQVGTSCVRFRKENNLKFQKQEK